jgi:hypothetical protein
MRDLPSNAEETTTTSKEDPHLWKWKGEGEGSAQPADLVPPNFLSPQQAIPISHPLLVSVTSTDTASRASSRRCRTVSTVLISLYEHLSLDWLTRGLPYLHSRPHLSHLSCSCASALKHGELESTASEQVSVTGGSNQWWQSSRPRKVGDNGQCMIGDKWGKVALGRINGERD